MIGQSGAIWIPSPFYSHFKWPYDGGRPKWIIIHGTASGIDYSAQSTGRDFQRQGNSTHYIVGYDGTIVQCVDESNPAWGNGTISNNAGVAPMGGGFPNAPHDAYWNTAGHNDPNGCTISIEHSKSTDNKSPLSNAQQAASFALIVGIMSRWGIVGHYGDASGGITGHYSMEPRNRSFCPGVYPWDALFSYISGTRSIFYSLPLSQDLPNTPPPTYTALSQQVHNTLVETPGFYGIALTLDEAEQFPGYIDLTSKNTANVGPVQLPDFVGLARSIGATISDNFIPFSIRASIVILGFILLLALLTKAVAPIARDVLPLVMG